MSAEPWRVLDSIGNIGAVPTPEPCGKATCGGARWRCGSEHGFRVFGSSPREAVVRYALETNSQIVEVRGPGELFAYEQVAAERERCLGWAEVVRDSAKSELRQLLTPEDAAHFGGAVIGARSVALGIEMGSPIPLKVTP